MWQFAFHGAWNFHVPTHAMGANVGEFYWLTSATAARWAMIIPWFRRLGREYADFYGSDSVCAQEFV